MPSPCHSNRSQVTTMTISKTAVFLGFVSLVLAGCSEEEPTKAKSAPARPAVVHVSACSLLAPTDVADAIGVASVSNAPERTMGGDAGQAFISTCVWTTPASAEATSDGQKSVTLMVWSWPKGTGSAQSFIQGFRDTAKMKSLPPPEELQLGDEAISSAEGVQARKGDFTLSVSATETGQSDKATFKGVEHQLAEKALAELKG